MKYGAEPGIDPKVKKQNDGIKDDDDDDDDEREKFFTITLKELHYTTELTFGVACVAATDATFS